MIGRLRALIERIGGLVPREKRQEEAAQTVRRLEAVPRRIDMLIERQKNLIEREIVGDGKGYS